MIVVDDAMIPAKVKQHDSRWSHMMSTLPGEEGTKELKIFATRVLGLRESYIQYEGQITEHYDLTKGKREQALKKGARAITWRQAAGILEAKGDGVEWTP